MTHPNRPRRTHYLSVMALLGAAVLVAMFLRFFKLDQIPPGFTFDEASHALDALDILRGNFFLISPRLEETPALYMYVVAVAFALFGEQAVVQRGVSAFFGVLLVPVNFLAVRTLFRRAAGRKALLIALFSSMLQAGSFWGVITSRKGFEYIVPPVFALLAIYCFWRGYPTRRWRWLLPAAFLSAIGFYFYNGAAPFLLVIPTAVLLHKIVRLTPRPGRGRPGGGRLASGSASSIASSPLKPPGGGKAFPPAGGIGGGLSASKPVPPISWTTWALFSLAAALVALPMFLTLTTGPNPEVNRSLGLLVFNEASSLSEALAILARRLYIYAQPFLALGGDSRWYSNLPGRPILNPLLAVCFVVGVGLSLVRFRQLPYLLLLVYFAGTLAPSLLTQAGLTESAFYFRMSGALPSTYIFVALTWTELYFWLKPRLTGLFRPWSPGLGRRLALLPFLLIGLFWLPFVTYRDYFLNWATQPEVAEAHDATVAALAARMERESTPGSIFILPRDSREPRPNYTLDFLYRGQTPFRYVIFDDAVIRPNLTEALAGYRTVHWISYLEGGRERVQHRASAHPTIALLFDKYGQQQTIEETESYIIRTYRLASENVDFEAHLQQPLPAGFSPISHIIGDQIELAGVEQQLTGSGLQIELAWRGWAPVSKLKADYTVFVQLLNSAGQRMSGVDIRPPDGFATLDRGEILIQQYLLPPPQSIEPGRYSLLVGLYYFEGEEVVTIGAVQLNEPVIIAQPPEKP